MKAPYSNYSAALPGYGTSLVDRINLYLHFRRYLKILTERWLLIVICTVLGLGISLFQAFNKPDIYRAQSVLQVTPKVNVGIIGAAQIEEDARMAENQITMMKSGAVILRVMAKLQEGSGSTNKLIRPTYEAFAGRGNTYVMEAKGTNLDLCQRFVTAWAEEFIDYKKGQRVLIKRSAEAATQREILNFERELTTAQEDLEQFKRQYNITDFKDAGARARERVEDVHLLVAQRLAELALEHVVDRVDDEVDHLDGRVDNPQLFDHFGESGFEEFVVQLHDNPLFAGGVVDAGGAHAHGLVELLQGRRIAGHGLILEQVEHVLHGL